MISLDWKDRLTIDTEDFVNRKLPQKNYDIDIVYNAYPKRVDNKIPAEVIKYVGKTLGSKIGKNIDQYEEFLDYLWEQKGTNGHLIFMHLMRIALVKKPDIYIDHLKKKVANCSDASEMKALIKTIMPLLKKNPKTYIDKLFEWLHVGNTLMQKEIIKAFIKAVKDDPELARYVFQKMERGWLYPNPYTIKTSSQYLKAISKIDPNYYYSIYENYKTSRNPVFVEILCEGLSPIEDPTAREKIEQYVINWTKSGNVRIKKAALSATKILNKKI